MLSALIGAWLGAITGWRTHSPLEKAFSGFVLCFYAIPVYCLSLLLLAALAKAITFSHGAMGFSSGTGNSMDWLRSLGLPLGVLILHGAAYNTLLMRSAVRKEMEASYVLTALAKGLSPWRVLLGHILKNTLPPYITVVALHAGFMTGGALLVEVVFSFQGMGTLIYQAVLSRDYPILSGSLTVLCLSVLAANGMAELLYRVLDPRPGENSRGG
jgi:peptide/nickel transport system permease protein